MRSYAWTEMGKSSAARHGVTEREVVDALYSPQRIENAIGEVLVAIAGLADSARVIVVLCEQVGTSGRGAVTFAIMAARVANAEEVKIWMEGTR